MAPSWPSFACLAFLILGANVLVRDGEASKILVVLPFSATSHNNVISSLSRELATRGHTVKVITPFPIQNPPKNYSEISVFEVFKSHFSAPKTVGRANVWETFQLIERLAVGICKGVFDMQEVKDLIKSAQSGEGYDLVIVSMFYNDCFYGFAHIFNAPLILISPAGSFPMTDLIIGNPSPPSFVPNLFSSFSDHMSFLERLQNTVMDLLAIGFHNFMIYPKLNAVMKGSFGDAIPTIQEIEKQRTSLVLLNTHHSILYPRPMVPNLVEVGGMHIKPSKPLPQDIKKFMDDAKEGVIYFSLGSNLKSADLPAETRAALLGAFSELKQTVLWKWEADSLPGQPPNVKLSKWWPQADILAHPNTKLFITHGGLLSFQEAVDRGVPLIGIPFYGDQELNMNRVISFGVGLKIDFSTITKEIVLKTISTILYDSSYHRKMKQLSAVWKDQKEPPLERAVYWTEYVLRHEGAYHLRSGALDLAWHQYYLLDVVAVVVMAILVLFSLVAMALCFVLRLCCRKNKPGKKGGKEGKSSKQKKH